MSPLSFSVGFLPLKYTDEAMICTSVTFCQKDHQISSILDNMMNGAYPASLSDWLW